MSRCRQQADPRSNQHQSSVFWKSLKLNNYRNLYLLLALIIAAATAAILIRASAFGGHHDSSWPEPSVKFRADFQADAPFPMDPSVTVGKLENGLSYYIVPNDDPDERILLTLVVRAGSLNEDHDQKGVAHFLEHMMFNGTQHFSTERLHQYFESWGIPMGQHLNAYTSYEQTVYFVSIDESQHEAVDSAFTLLSDWAQGSLLQREEVEKEKGVVEEEWRLSQEEAWDRTWNQIWQVLLINSLYAARSPIGDIHVIRSLTPDLLRRFQEDWYRPDLMTVAVIGDIDPEEAEKQIRQHFAVLPMPKDARPFFEVPIPGQTEGHIEIRADPALTEVWLQVFQLLEAQPIEKTEDYRQVLLAELTALLLYWRLDDLQDVSETPYEDLLVELERQGFGKVTLVRVGTRLNESFLMAGLTEVLTELRRAQLQGFTRRELEDAKSSLIYWRGRDSEKAKTRHNSEIQEDLLKHLTTGFPLVSTAFELDLVRHYLPGISLREVNDFMASLLSPERSLVFLAGPAKDDLVLPGTDEIRRVLTQRLARPQRSSVFEQPAADLVVEIPQPVGPVNDRWNPRLALYESTYANGLKVLLRRNSTEESALIFDLTNQGGRSRVDSDSFYAAFLVADAALQSGAGHLDGDHIDEVLESKSITFEPYLSEAAEGYYGEADAHHLETVFELLHLFLTQPRFNESAFKIVWDEHRAVLRNQILDPHFALLDRVTALRYPNHQRFHPMMLTDLSEVDFAKAQKIHAERFTAMDPPTLALAGDFDFEEAKRLINTYLGPLTFSNKAETWQDQSPASQPGPLRDYIYHGQGTLVLVEQAYGHSQVSDLNQADAVALRILARILHSRLEYQLREELGGTYFVEVYVWLQTGPHAGANLVIRFATNEGQAEELMQTSRSVMREILDQGITARELAAAKKQLLVDLKANRNDNYYWVDALFYEFVYGSGELDQVDREEEYIKNLTPSGLNALAPVVLNVDRLVEVVLLPENSVSESSSD